MNKDYDLENMSISEIIKLAKQTAIDELKEEGKIPISNRITIDLSMQFINIFQRKFAEKFKTNLLMDKKILYSEFRKLCGRSFCFNKNESNKILDSLKKLNIIELNSNGFIVRDKKFFMN